MIVISHWSHLEMDKYDQLRQWVDICPDDLQVEFDETARATIQELLRDLVDEEGWNVEITEENFPELVAELYEHFVLGSKEFGKSLLLAEDFVSKGMIDEAVAELNSFMEWTQSSFYRNMADQQVARISKNEINNREQPE
jgi:sulfite reductase alpha subunit-like flavoprotein